MTLGSNTSGHLFDTSFTTNGVIYSAASGVMTSVAAGTTGQVLSGNTGSAPSWATGATGNVTGPGSSTDRAIATWNSTGGNILFDNSTVKISSAGEMTNTTQPAFFAYLPSTVLNVTGNGTAFTIGATTALTEVFDQGGDFNTNGTFTAPVTGRYQISFGIRSTGFTVATKSEPEIDTSNRTYFVANLNPTNCKDSDGNLGQLGSTLVDMDSADTCIIKIAIAGEAGATVDIAGSSVPVTWVSGNLVC